jgi:RND superfamily putative drug exporter
MLPLYKTATIGGKNSPFSQNGIVTSVLVQPTTAPDDPATNDLLNRLRTVTTEQIAPTGAMIYVGGTQAVTQDFTNVLISVLPLFLLVVIGLGFVALFLLFRSLLIPMTAAVTSLLSFSAALGVTVAVFQWGWGASLIGVATTGPILPFLPIMVFAILFGLSMDYEVFLVSRMQEGWHETGDNGEAVRHGLAGSGKVVVAAALIMSSVFLAFVPVPNDTIKLFGVALASAVIIDAFIVRLVLVPSVMSMFGRANWWLPGWLSRRLPNFSVE